MATVTLRGNPINTNGELPAVGSKIPDFQLTGTDLGDVTLESFAGQPVVLNIFPSIDTPTCAASTRTFNQRASEGSGINVLCVSQDLPFAMSRFCGAEGLDKVTAASGFRSSFADDFGVRLVDGPLRGLAARAVVVVDADGKVTYTELVPEIGQEPDYDAALAALG